MATASIDFRSLSLGRDLKNEYEQLNESSYEARFIVIRKLAKLNNCHMVKFLLDLAVSPLPDEDHEIEYVDSSQTEEKLIRLAAAEAVAKCAGKGNKAAKDLILNFLIKKERTLKPIMRVLFEGYVQHLDRNTQKKLRRLWLRELIKADHLPLAA